jgi:hypothetical protein
MIVFMLSVNQTYSQLNVFNDWSLDKGNGSIQLEG